VASEDGFPPDTRPSFVPSSSCGNDREEKIRIPAGTCIQRRFAPKNLGRPIAQVVVQKRPAAFKLVFEAR